MSGAETASTVYRILGVVSSIFAFGVIAVSGTLLNQAVRYRDQFYYGGGYDNYFGGGGLYNSQGGLGYEGLRRDGLLRGTGYFRGLQGDELLGGMGYRGGLAGYPDGGYGFNKYQKVMAIAAVALGAGVIQFLFSTLLCCSNENTAKGLGISYVAGAVFSFLLLAICFGFALACRVLYPFYIYNLYLSQLSYSSYYEYNPEGSAFCAVLVINAIYLLISAIIAGVFAQQAQPTLYDDRIEYQLGKREDSSYTTPTSPTRHKYEHRV